jgi:hypothetical protein
MKTLTKSLFGLMIFLGLFITSCTNTTEPVDSVKKVEYIPKISEAQDIAESLVTESFKKTAESFIGTDLMKESAALGKSNDEQTYYYFDGFHIWRGDMEYALFDIEDSYNAQYLTKVQFLNNNVPQQSPVDAQMMRMYLNAHFAFGFVGNEPYGDEVWYDFEGAATPLNGWPTVINAGGEYERRWVGTLNDEDTELHYSVYVGINNVQFFYDWNADDFYLNGIVTVYGNGFKILIRFTNSRTASVETYQNDSLVSITEMTLPNYYQELNIPSLENWHFGADFAFPIPVIF